MTDQEAIELVVEHCGVSEVGKILTPSQGAAELLVSVDLLALYLIDRSDTLLIAGIVAIHIRANTLTDLKLW